MQLALQQIVFNEVKIRFCPAIGVTLHVYGGSDLAAFEAKHKLSDYSAAASVEGHTLCVVCPGIHLASNMFTGGRSSRDKCRSVFHIKLCIQNVTRLSNCT